jgi:segregation and condensation protein A
MDYQVELDIFRGPLDLLLFLVKRNEVDILDIPIARIAEQYVHYLEVLKLIDVERVGDFLVMAATLMEIKSRMLLPSSELPEEDGPDPRNELVRQLLQYKQFKDAAALLQQRAEEQAMRLPRQPPDRAVLPIDPAQQPIQQVELWDLVSAFSRLLRETLALQPSQIILDETPISVHMERILERLSRTPRLSFLEVFDPPRQRGRLIGLFMALLELIKANRINVEQEAPFAEIWLTLTANGESDASAPPLTPVGGADANP